MNGKFIVIVGPSGGGKGTLIKHLQSLFPALVYPKSFVTRPMRPGEIDGDVYRFIGVEEFKERISRDDFLEWAVYGGNYYGTPASEVLPRINRGEIVLKELEVQGARQLKKKMSKDELAIIFIDAGSWQDMKKRIKKRSPITAEELKKREERYKDEITFIKEADFVVKNETGKLDEAKEQIEAVVRSLLAKVSA
ncbi:guanylate kinase [Candidatus Giovannonibacteria bacterium]|nr:guanylate kinase [Candidatus Giovannonibacteria bacterium]